MQQVDVPIYDFKTHQRSPETRRVEPADVVIVEGIMVLHMEEVRQMLNMKIYVDTDDDVRLARRYVCSSEPIFSSALRCTSARLLGCLAPGTLCRTASSCFVAGYKGMLLSEAEMWQALLSSTHSLSSPCLTSM